VSLIPPGRCAGCRGVSGKPPTHCDECWMNIVGEVKAGGEAAQLVMELRRKLIATRAAGEKLAAHLRNCGGCIGCDDAIAEWREVTK
jgi:hypothetical protein